MYSKHSASVAAPPHRRRRPALSCLQCRRRKVRCDQKTPCSQCRRSKDTVCAYSSEATLSLATRNIHHEYSQIPSESNHSQQPGTLATEYRIPTPDSTVVTISARHSPYAHGNSASPDADRAERNGEHIKSAVSRPLENVYKQATDVTHITYSPYVERHVTEQEAMPDLPTSQRKFPLKMKLFGESHWMYQMLQLDRLCDLLGKHMRSEATAQPTDLILLLKKCKDLGRKIKSENAVDRLNLTNFKDSIPSRNVCDELVAHYLRAFESVYRILHVPSFKNEYEDYWINPQSASPAFVMKLLLILAIGISLWQDSESRRFLRSLAHQWVHVAQQWVSAPLEKSRMNLGGLQVQCLLILAREAVGVGSDLIWISAGTLLRTAMQLGYHRDPKKFPEISVLHAEMRRRLWATILEIVIQTSYDSAMPPLIALHDFDTKPPLNVDDDEISKSTKIAPHSKPLTTFTQTSLQILLNKSVNTRLEILRLTTSFSFEAPYEEILNLNLLITNACPTNPPPPPNCHLNYLEVLIRRPLFSLHRRHCVQARTDPRYYFSRKISFDTALAALSFAPSDDYTRLLRNGSGIWRETSVLAFIVISLELTMQLEEEALNPPSPMQLIRARSAREPLIQALRDSQVLAMDRLREGDLNVKGHLFSSLVLAQLEAMEVGEAPELMMEAAAKTSLEESYAILKDMCTTLTGAGLDTDEQSDEQSGDAVYDGDFGDVNYDFLLDAGLDFDAQDTTGLFDDWGNF